jgi:hypothetical protein
LHAAQKVCVASENARDCPALHGEAGLDLVTGVQGNAEHLCPLHFAGFIAKWRGGNCMIDLPDP